MEEENKDDGGHRTPGHPVHPGETNDGLRTQDNADDKGRGGISEADAVEAPADYVDQAKTLLKLAWAKTKVCMKKTYEITKHLCIILFYLSKEACITLKAKSIVCFGHAKEMYHRIPIYVETREERNQRWLENLFFWVKVFGSLISLLDIFVKVYYYEKSRWTTKELEEIYISIFYFRPILISVVLLYNFIINLKRICINKNKKTKKYKDDVAY